MSQVCPSGRVATFPMKIAGGVIVLELQKKRGWRIEAGADANSLKGVVKVVATVVCSSSARMSYVFSILWYAFRTAANLRPWKSDMAWSGAYPEQDNLGKRHIAIIGPVPS